MQIIEIVQRNLGFSELKKIDPNTQETKGEKPDMGNNALAQAGIPAILLGIYNRLEVNPDISILENPSSAGLLAGIFGKSADEVIQKIKDYSQIKDAHCQQQLEHIASESIRVVKESIGDVYDETNVRKFIASNKPHALLYLPPSLDLGTLLHQDNLDDNTGKMEGPVSSLIQKVGKAFNSTIGS